MRKVLLRCGCLCVVLWAMLWGCAIPLDVQAREDLTITIDLDRLLSRAGINKQQLFPDGKLPPDYKLKLPFWTSVPYDISENPQIKKVRERIKKFSINRLTYHISENTLSIDVPSAGEVLEVWLAEHGKTNQKDFSKVGYVYPIPAKRVGVTDRLLFDEGGEETALAFFKDLAFSFGVRGILTLDGSVDPTVPSGKIKLTITIDVQLRVDLPVQE